MNGNVKGIGKKWWDVMCLDVMRGGVTLKT